MNEYDSTEDTLKHIERVREFIGDIIYELGMRGTDHDSSKLESPEKEMYDKYTPLLSSVTYGSEEYRKYLAEMGIALKHHYENNSHHPEHYEFGIHGMTLLDLVEMLCDWKAASLRHADGNMAKSMEINRKRFDIEDQLYNVFINTLKELNW